MLHFDAKYNLAGVDMTRYVLHEAFLQICDEIAMKFFKNKADKETGVAELKRKIAQLEDRVTTLMLEKFVLAQENEELRKMDYSYGISSGEKSKAKYHDWSNISTSKTLEIAGRF